MAAIPFKTPANQQSFSGLVDAVVLATGKPASLINIVQYVNAVLQECQALGLFPQDLVEDELTVPSDLTPGTVYTWDRPPLFRSLRTVKYRFAYPSGIEGHVYPDLAPPGKVQHNKPWLYYSAQNYFVFKGVGPNDLIDTATYYWFPVLGYYSVPGVNTSSFPGGPYDPRPAYYDTAAMQWMYLQADGITYENSLPDPTQEPIAQNLTSNWMIQQWYNLIMSGAKNRTFLSAGDPRAGAEYSIYTRLQKLLQNTSGYEGEGF